MKTKSVKQTIGGITFEAQLPIAAGTARGVEARHMAAWERRILEALCAFGKPTSDGFKFLRLHAHLKAAELAELIDARPETISRWENDKNEVPGAAWELLVAITEERLSDRSDTLDRLRRRLAQSDGAPKHVAMGVEDFAAAE